MALLLVEYQSHTRGAILPPRVLIGRRSMNHLVIDDPTVSRMHAWIDRRGDDFILTDMRSRTGTRVNGRPLARRRKLLSGDIIEIGPAKITFVSSDALPADVEPLDLPREPAMLPRDLGIRFDCPHCHAPMWASVQYAGHGGICTYCGDGFTIPRTVVPGTAASRPEATRPAIAPGPPPAAPAIPAAFIALAGSTAPPAPIPPAAARASGLPAGIAPTAAQAPGIAPPDTPQHAAAFFPDAASESDWTLNPADQQSVVDDSEMAPLAPMPEIEEPASNGQPRRAGECRPEPQRPAGLRPRDASFANLAVLPSDLASSGHNPARSSSLADAATPPFSAGRSGSATFDTGKAVAAPRPMSRPERPVAAHVKCGVCHSPILPDEAQTACPTCNLKFHLECWQENYGCSAYGCPQVNVLAPAADPAAETATVQEASIDVPAPRTPWEHLLLGLSAIGAIISAFTFGAASLGTLIWTLVYFRSSRSDPSRKRGPVMGAIALSLAGLAAGPVLSYFLFLYGRG